MDIAWNKISSYEDMVESINHWGLMPLSQLVVNYPSMEALTEKEAWHSETDQDPWRWRVRLADEKAAVYGKFFKKKPIFLSLQLFPHVRSWLADRCSVAERYEAGLLSTAAFHMYQSFQDRQIIDARELRGLVGMKAKEQKTVFDNALVELQASFDLVTTGSIPKINSKGEQSGWNSMGFAKPEDWFSDHPNLLIWHDPEESRQVLTQHLASVASDEARKQWSKLLRL